jgi:hypothetical protein
MRRDRHKTNWLIDASLFAGFLGSLWLDLTGVAAHQWLGLTVAVFSGYHLWKHRSWVKAVSGRLLDNASRHLRACYLVDAGLAAGFAAITVTGVAISTWLNVTLPSYAAWHAVHVVASVGTLALLVAKIGLHWRWIVDVARRRVFKAPGEAPAAPATPRTVKPAGRNVTPVAAAARLGRRDFVRLMAGTGAVALLSGVNALGAVKTDAVEASQATQTTGLGSVAAESAGSSTTYSSSCTVRCNRGCSYPGHCGRYTDSNNNGRCDLGECAA